MGSGLADHKPAAVGTGGSESNRASGAAVGTVASPHASPSTTCTPPLLPQHKKSHSSATPLSQESVQPLPPSSHPTMGGGLADHVLAAAGTGGSEFSDGTVAMELFERFMREEETDPSIGALAKTVQKAALAMEAGLPPPFTKYSPWRTLDDGPGRSLCLHQVLTKCCRHLEMPHPPTTSLPQESAQPLSPSTYHTMGDGLADHEPAVAETGGSESSHASEDEFEPREASHPPAIPPSQESAQPLPPSSYNTMGGGLAEHEPAVAATGGSEFRNASKDASKDESETLTPSQKKRIKRKESKAKRDAEVSQRSGVHTRSERVLRTSPRRKATEAELAAASARADIMQRRKQKSSVHTRFPEDGADQASVLPVSVNAVS